jgi:hypothetical protein
MNGWPPPASTASLALTLLFHTAVLPEDQRHAQHFLSGGAYTLSAFAESRAGFRA